MRRLLPYALVCVVACTLAAAATMGLRGIAVVAWGAVTLALGGAWYLAERPHERRELRRRRREQGQCGACGYDLTGNASGVCPECGRTNR